MSKTTTKQVKTAAAHVKNIRISPRKMRLVTNLVKNMWAYEAITQLEFTNKKGAKYVIDMIRSAMANAENNFKLDGENLYIKNITCDAGPKIKRYMPRAQGRASEIRRPLSHIHVLLEERKSTKKRSARFAAAKKNDEAKRTVPESVEKATEKKTSIPAQPGKNEQQIKQNKVTQKRRLFNRKSGV